MTRIVRERARSRWQAKRESAPTRAPVSGVDLQRQQDTADCLGVAHCPWCRGPLVVLMSRAGPYWHCLCAVCARR